MISKWLFSGAFLLELGALGGIAGGMPGTSALLLYGLAHALASLLLAAAVWRLLPADYRQPLPWSPLFLFCLAFFIPLFGILGVACAVFPALYLPRRRSEQPWQATTLPELPFQPRQRHQQTMFGDGGLQDVLGHAPDPERRLAAVFATRRMRGRDAIPVLKMALRDPADDVRLLAYSMLDQRETRINQRIEGALERLAATPAERRAALHGVVARWYWELAYVGLAQGSVLAHVLEQAGEHAREALGERDNAELQLLLGRIALEQGRPEQARESLRRARELGMDADQVSPYLAEAAFLLRDYREVGELLGAIPAPALRRPPLAALAEYWL